MRKFFLAFLFCLSGYSLSAQECKIRGIVCDDESKEPLAGVTVSAKDTPNGAKTNLNGTFAISKLPCSEFLIKITYHGYISKEISIDPIRDTSEIEVLLTIEEHEGEEVVVTGTRTSRSIADVPVRVEAIPEEEIGEKIMMRASNVSMTLSETPSIRVQTTSATSNAANLRILGLDGRYTQILVDGIPNFGGLSSGLGVMQFPPLNLRQIEIIKGASSVLYGADAIAGVVNFLTKQPQTEEKLSSILNATSQKGYDGSAFYSSPAGELAFTAYASYNHQTAFDVDGDNFADLARYDRINAAPYIYYTPNEKMNVVFGIGYLHERRRGGVMDAPDDALGKNAPYLEEIISNRLYGSARLNWQTTEKDAFIANIGLLQLDRSAHYGSSPFDGVQQTSYSDLQYSLHPKDHELVLGAAFTSDRFSDNIVRNSSLEYNYTVPGLFIQDEWSVTDIFHILAGGRIDFHNTFGTFVTPRLGLFFKPSKNITMRLGAGGGFKAPNGFVEEAEQIGYREIRGVNTLEAERAGTATFDMNWRTTVGEVAISSNLALLYSNLEHGLVANEDSLSKNILILESATGPTIARGVELTSILTYTDFKLFLAYTFTYATQEHKGIRSEMELNPRHNISTVLMWEEHETGWRVGLENYYIGKQLVDDNPFRTRTPDYMLTGALIEKSFGNVSVYINFENIFDARHTKYDPTFTGDPFITGNFTQLHIYAPLEGRAINGGIRLNF